MVKKGGSGVCHRGRRVAKLEGWVAKLEAWVAKLEAWVAKLEG